MNERDKTTSDIRVRAIVNFIFIQITLLLLDSTTSYLHGGLKYQFVSEALVTSSTFIMSGTFTTLATLLVCVNILVYGVLGFVTLMSTVKCVNVYQTSECFSRLVPDYIVAFFLGVAFLLNVFQFLSLRKLQGYLALKAEPPAEQHILQRRVRLLHIWCIPFQIAMVFSASNTLSSIRVLGPMCLAPISAFIATEEKPASIHVIGLTMATVALLADLVNGVFAFRTESTYYLRCLATVVLFDVLAVSLRSAMACYNAKKKKD